jgi:hypothetical protein
MQGIAAYIYHLIHIRTRFLFICPNSGTICFNSTNRYLICCMGIFKNLSYQNKIASSEISCKYRRFYNARRHPPYCIELYFPPKNQHAF